MILGGEFEAVPFDKENYLSEEEMGYAKSFARPFGLAMLFNEFLTRLKQIQPDMTAERLKGYFTESTREVCGILARPDPSEEADQLVSLALGFLDFNAVFDIDIGEFERDDNPPLTKFAKSIFPDYRLDDPVQQKKIFTVVLFGGMIEDGMKERADYIFSKANLTL